MADFDFDAAASDDATARDVDLPVDAADLLWMLEVAVERCAEPAGAALAVGFFFDGATAGGFFAAVFFADGVDEAVRAAAGLACGDCAGRLVPDSRRQVETTATQ